MSVKGNPQDKTVWKQGWREIGSKRCYFRSKWEANYARFLQYYKEQNLIKEWEHENKTFWFEGIKRGVVSYLPDFEVTLMDGSIQYHEVKGYMDSRSATKIKRMAKYHPKVLLRVIDKEWFKKNNSIMRAVVKDWE